MTFSFTQPGRLRLNAANFALCVAVAIPIQSITNLWYSLNAHWPQKSRHKKFYSWMVWYDEDCKQGIRIRIFSESMHTLALWKFEFYGVNVSW